MGRNWLRSPMLYLEHTPGPLLRPFIRRLWYCRAREIAHRYERVLPDGCMQIVVNLQGNSLTDCGESGEAGGALPGAVVVGVRSRFEVVDTADMRELAGVCFHPGGFPALFRERADVFFERFIALDDIWPQAAIADRLREAVTPAAKLRRLEALLARPLAPRRAADDLVRHALQLFGDGTSVAECARSAGVSERRLSGAFNERVGMGPKLWCRIRRFQRALRTLHLGAEVRWAELALACGYYDQAHFANDFRAFSGINPTTYSLRRGPWLNHVAIP